MEDKKGGCFLLARSFVQDSELWKYKPSTWSKIWVYILEGVNYEASKTMERGEGYFNFTKDIQNIGCDITKAQVRSSLRYFKDNEMIATTKTTRGMRIKVLNYAEYQDFCNYLTTTPTTTRQQQNNNGTTTITKRIKENKENKESISMVAIAPDLTKKSDILVESMKPIIEDLILNGADEQNLRKEANKFHAYWTEPNKSQTRLRHELEKTWDTKRRLATWLDRANQNFKANSPNTKKTWIC